MPRAAAVLLILPAAACAASGDEAALARSQETLRMAPLSAVRADFFHAALEVPPLAPARTIEPGTGFLRLRSSAARSTAEDDRPRLHDDDFDATFREWLSAEGAWGLSDGFEAGVRAAFAGWDEHVDRFDLFSDSGRILVRDEFQSGRATERHANLSVLVLRAKARLAGTDALDLSLQPSLKMPVGRARDLTNAGTWDSALTLLGSAPLGGATVLHGNLGVTVPEGGQNLFERRTGIGIGKVLHGGLGIARALGGRTTALLQLEANSSAFGEVPLLRRPPAGVLLGLRTATGGALVEVGLGTGLDWRTSAMVRAHLAVTFVF